MVDAFERGEGTASEVALRFGVSRRSVQAWTRRFRMQGTLEPASRGGGNFSQVDVSRLLGALEERRDATTDEITRAYDRGLSREQRVHRSSILRALKREGFVFKKNVRGPQNKTGRTSVRSGSSSRAG